MGRPRLWQEPTKPISVRIPVSWIAAYAKLSDEKNPPHDLMRDALKEFLERQGSGMVSVTRNRESANEDRIRENLRGTRESDLSERNDGATFGDRRVASRHEGKLKQVLDVTHEAIRRNGLTHHPRCTCAVCAASR